MVILKCINAPYLFVSQLTFRLLSGLDCQTCDIVYMFWLQLSAVWLFKSSSLKAFSLMSSNPEECQEDGVGQQTLGSGSLNQLNSPASCCNAISSFIEKLKMRSVCHPVSCLPEAKLCMYFLFIHIYMSINKLTDFNNVCEYSKYALTHTHIYSI